ncbi:MAG TPA: class I SAM-dependent methyltransferase [Pirellulaceae bacterium]
MTPQSGSVQEGYDRWATIYDHDANPLPPLEEPQVRSAVGPIVGRRVLDLGCGTGRHTLWLAEGGAQVTAVDFSDAMLAKARRKVTSASVEFLRMDLHEPLPFPDEAYDVVVSGLVLEHLRELPAFFRECRRVLRPGGLAVCSSLHPAMFLRGSQARFTDPESGAVIRVGSHPHSLGDMVMGALRASFQIRDLGEFSPDAEFAQRFPRAEKYVGWPMLVVLSLHADAEIGAAERPKVRFDQIAGIPVQYSQDRPTECE